MGEDRAAAELLRLEQEKQARQEAAIARQIERAAEKRAEREKAEAEIGEVPENLSDEDVLREMRHFCVKNLKLMNKGVDILGREKTVTYKLVELLAKFDRAAAARLKVMQAAESDGDDVDEKEAERLLKKFRKEFEQQGDGQGDNA